MSKTRMIAVAAIVVASIGVLATVLK